MFQNTIVNIKLGFLNDIPRTMKFSNCFLNLNDSEKYFGDFSYTLYLSFIILNLNYEWPIPPFTKHFFYNITTYPILIIIKASRILIKYAKLARANNLFLYIISYHALHTNKLKKRIFLFTKYYIYIFFIQYYCIFLIYMI